MRAGDSLLLLFEQSLKIMNCIKKHIIYFLTLSLFFSNISCGNKKEEKTNIISDATMGIVLTRNTTLRIDPFIFSARIDLLKKGTTIEIKGKSSSKTWIGKSKDYWYKVKLHNNLTGWIFGKNLRIISSEKDDLTDYVNNFWEKETLEMKKDIAGKWWSQNSFGDFTRHAIEFAEDGRYKSYMKAANPKIYEGIYNFDFEKNEILFLKGASFGKKLEFIKRGQIYILRKELKVGELIFKKIAIETTIKEIKDKKKK
jgi:SH3 domain-containing protein